MFRWVRPTIDWCKAEGLRIIEVFICLIRKLWRPVSCAGLATSVWINLVIIPWSKGVPIEFAPASAFVAAITTAFAVREAGKYLGTADK